MELLAAGGRGVVKLFQAAENGEPWAFGVSGLLIIYIAAVVVFLGVNWATGRPVRRKRDLIGYTLAGGMSLAFSVYVLHGIISRLMA